MPSVSLPDEVSAACAWVAERARSVRLVEERIAEALGQDPEHPLMEQFAALPQPRLLTERLAS